MPWIEVRFKGKTVWAEAGPDGALLSEGGRTPIRYSRTEGAKLYRASTGSIEHKGGSGVELPAGVPADASPASARKGSSRGSGFGSAGKRTAAQASAAQADARQRIGALSDNTHQVFTDGACRGNPGPAGAGAVLKLADGRILEEGRSLGIATNNVGELTAVGMGLDLLEQAGVPRDAAVVLFTDSQYTLGVLTKGWKAKANTELILGLRARLKLWRRLRIEWVAGHVGLPENERADQLASQSCRG